MQSNYRRLGDYIRLVDERNRNLEVETLLGVSIQKVLMPSIANTIGTDMSTYKIIKRNQFAYGTVTSRNGDKISIALLKKYDKALVSQVYLVFEIIDENLLLPDYLMMWFRRPEFDRYARFKSHGSARETFDWGEMLETELPIPSIEKQKEIVAEYEAVEQRIQLNKKLCEKLEETAQTIYRNWFEDFEFPNEEGKPYKSSGGEMVECEELEKEIPKGWRVDSLKNLAQIKGGKRLPKGEELNNNHQGNPYIKVADMSFNRFLTLNKKFQYVDESIQKVIRNYVVHSGDLIISIVGTIGLINIIYDDLDGANLTENCFKIINLNGISVDYLYAFLNSSKGKQEIIEKTVGGVQGKLPMYSVESFNVLVPKEEVANTFSRIMRKINKKTTLLIKQTQKLEELKSLLLGKMAVEEY